MKKLNEALFAIVIYMCLAIATPLNAQDNYKHPHLNSSGHVVDSTGTKLGWIRDGVVYNSKGEEVALIKKKQLVDSKGHLLGSIAKDGTFSDTKGTVVFTIESGSKGDKCKVLDPKGKVIATVHDSYKNQACAIHCLYKKMPMK